MNPLHLHQIRPIRPILLMVHMHRTRPGPVTLQILLLRASVIMTLFLFDQIRREVRVLGQNEVSQDRFFIERLPVIPFVPSGVGALA